MNPEDELTRLRAAVGAIHNYLHAGNVSAAHQTCECAGGEVRQPNLTVPQSAKAQVFAARFNELCQELDMRAAFVAMMPSATVRGATSLQIGGEVETCKIVEAQFHHQSSYQNDHLITK